MSQKLGKVLRSNFYEQSDIKKKKKILGSILFVVLKQYNNKILSNKKALAKCSKLFVVMDIHWFKTFIGFFHSSSVIFITYETNQHFSCIEKYWDLDRSSGCFVCNKSQRYAPVFVDALIAKMLTRQWQCVRFETTMTNVIYKRSIQKKLYQINVEVKYILFK